MRRRGDALARRVGVEHRNGAAARVCKGAWVREEGPRLAELHDPAQYMTATRLQMCSTSRKSWAMKQVSELQPLFQIEHQPDDLRLDRDVERGHGFVRDERCRPAPGRDPDSLPLTAAELVRIPRKVAGRARPG